MNDFKPGQRWICDVDLQLGLGIIQTVEARTLSIIFPAVGETRSYAKQSAPLTRVIFSVGDTLRSSDDRTIQVQSLSDADGVITYVGTDESGQDIALSEAQLANFFQFNRPAERLFNNQFDADKWFQLRHQTWTLRNQLIQSPIYGLTGTRTSLIPHQLYIAHEVAKRFAPRVLLADEVGLGKTIEAGLILHQQLLTERVKRVLIVVPETLVHQWLVEMLRRFNLHFSVFDESRCETLTESDEQDNPFHSEQLILCGLDFLSQNPDWFEFALDGNWDLLIVDEAHHLEWSAETASPEYSLIEQLSAQTKGVLLLTATPEQLGKASHFARLRLLDPDRFSSLEHFIDEEQSYEPIAQAVTTLKNGQSLDDETVQAIQQAATEDSSLHELLRNATQCTDETDHTALAEQLLDRYGTGRVLFRNTRAAVKGFPQREVNAAPLPLPEDYRDCYALFEEEPLSFAQLLLSPEILYQARAEDDAQPWTDFDPRIDWLITTLKSHKTEKILIITASMQTAKDIAQAVKAETGQHLPVFHEYMSLIERDRAAAFFADPVEGSQALICSEIGSEGRNFQFAHHLVLFDLPLNPDLLEQRIGRLDRIGQTQTIHIHVPYLEHCAQAVMFDWYHLGLNAFEKTCPAGQAIFSQVQPTLEAALHRAAIDPDLLQNLIDTTQTSHQTLNDALEKGRNRLLEYNSYRAEDAKKLQQLARQQDNHSDLPGYMDTVFDCFGVHIEEHRTESYFIEPSEHMTTSFAGLSDEGLVITYQRDVALANENMHFLTWEHPMVMNAMERILSEEFGNAIVTAIKHKAVKPGSLFLESLYIASADDHHAENSYYLPPIMIRVLLDENMDAEHPNLDHATINDYQTTVSIDIAKQVIALKEDTIKSLITESEHLAQQQAPAIIAESRQHTAHMLNLEIERLTALQQINPSVREEEIQFFQQQLNTIEQAAQHTHLQLDALRVIVAI